MRVRPQVRSSGEPDRVAVTRQSIRVMASDWPVYCCGQLHSSSAGVIEGFVPGNGALPLMSIYQTRRKRQINDHDVTWPVTGGGTLKPACLPPAGPVHWYLLRKARPVNYMLPMSIGWLRSLPREVRPIALATQYPRIANLLALEWSKPAACRAYFIALLVDHRGKRKGFPPDVHRDLLRLRDYYCGLDLTLDE